jgi:hypothetical protein
LEMNCATARSFFFVLASAPLSMFTRERDCQINNPSMVDHISCACSSPMEPREPFFKDHISCACSTNLMLCMYILLRLMEPREPFVFENSTLCFKVPIHFEKVLI